ncbi:RNA-binding protein 48 isoform X2 [Chiloscyllium plagiosum]|uniref:RNA-binding protein 48 isoform X2 n=1 Tax=Chiloscyllium plagiosum TaxID=36176 RepID=UPI001CB847EF|nr:RNA-binding protein 48 isoform X2 [Chiloscyllium plagiosum]
MAVQVPEVFKHHQQENVCFTRPKYREGRRLRAVKVYTINLESKHLLIQGVPAVGVMKELIELFALYGTIEEYSVLHEYPAEEFTEVYRIKYQRLQSARVAKRKQDERSFFGSLLHVCYAPEFESVEDTREKLKERRRYIMRSTSNKDIDLYKAGKKVIKPAPLANTAKEAFSERPEHYESLESNQMMWNIDSIYSYPMPLPPFQPDNPAPSSTSNFRQECPQMPSSYGTLSKDIPLSAASQSYFESKLLCFHDQHLDKSCDSKDSWSSERKTWTPNIGSSVSKFVPRTTQLQGRKKINQEMNINKFYGFDTDSTTVEFGPKLPEMPKMDLGDTSLNVSATLIRNKLTEVLSASTKEAEVLQIKAPKQRRRI